jgi:uncharacterized protein VirK/YbjX
MGYLFLNKPPFIKSGLYSGIFKSQKNLRRYIKWQIRILHARIAVLLSHLQKVNKHFTKRRVSKTNHRDALVAELLESNRDQTDQETVETEVSEIDGKN